MNRAMDRRSLRDEHRAATRTALLSAATERFAARGFAATSIDDIAEHARVTKGAVYYHFKNKRQIFEAVYEEQAAALTRRVRDAMAAAADPVAKMRAAADAFFASTHDETTRRLMFADGPSVLGGVDCRRIDDEHFLGLLQTMLSDLQGLSLFPEIDVALLAKMVLAVLIEASHALGATDDPGALRPELERIAARAIRGFAAGA